MAISSTIPTAILSLAFFSQIIEIVTNRPSSRAAHDFVSVSLQNPLFERDSASGPRNAGFRWYWFSTEKNEQIDTAIIGAASQMGNCVISCRDIIDDAGNLKPGKSGF